MECKLAVPKVTGNVCYALLLILVIALPLTFCQVTHATENFAASDYFAIPELEGRINFAGGGSYNNASLSNNTWHFTGLTFAGAKSALPNFNGVKLSVSAQNCDMTITRLDVLNVFPPSSGWLEYTVTGVGTQTVNLHYAQNAWLSYIVYVDNAAKAQNDGWSVTEDGWLTVTSATSNVKIQYERASVSLTAADVFTVPAFNSSINFAFSGTYVYASLENDTWRFQNLFMNEYKPTYGAPTWALGVSARNCNMTITSYRALVGTDQGGLSYTVTGLGEQAFKVDYDRFNNYPINYTVYVDGAAKAQNETWSLSNDGWLTITGATSNVSISFEWIVPDWVKDLPKRSGPSLPHYELYVLAIIALIIISATIVLIFRRKKETKTQKATPITREHE